jgi:hypothetical protein
VSCITAHIPRNELACSVPRCTHAAQHELAAANLQASIKALQLLFHVQTVAARAPPVQVPAAWAGVPLPILPAGIVCSSSGAVILQAQPARSDQESDSELQCRPDILQRRHPAGTTSGQCCYEARVDIVRFAAEVCSEQSTSSAAAPPSSCRHGQHAAIRVQTVNRNAGQIFCSDVILQARRPGNLL